MELTYDPRLDKFLRALSKKDLARIIRVAELFKKGGFSLSKLYLKKLARNLWELRAEK